MNESTNHTPATHVANGDEFDHRLAILKIEVSRDFPQLLPQLEAGRKVVLITDKELGSSLHPDVLRRLGGMIMLCSLLGAAVVFVNGRHVLEISGEDPSTIP